MKYMKAKFAFQARNNDELSFDKGDVITITQQIEGGWWEGTLNGKTGWFPSNYAIECRTDDRAVNPPNAVLVDQSTQEQHHQLVITHLIESEQEYVDLLCDLNDRCLQPLSETNILNKQELSTLCSNVEQMCSFQRTFLHSLSQCAKQPVSHQRVGGTFLSNASLLQNIYENYGHNHPDTVVILNKYRSQLDTYMESVGAASPGTKSLTNSLAAPLVRLDKYPALLKELEIHIDEGHVDRGDTQRALGVMRDLQVACLDARKEREMHLDIESSDLSGWEGEELASLGPVRLSSHVRLRVESAESSDRVALLLDNCIILLSVNQSLHYHYQGKLMLVGLKVKLLEDDESRSNALELSGSMINAMVLSFPSPVKRAKWYKLITYTKDTTEEEPPNVVETPKPVKSKTLPPQVTSKASIKTLASSAKTAEVLQSSQVIESYDRLAQSNRSNALKQTGPWSMSCLRPLPPSRPIFMSPEDSRSPKLQRKASTLGRRKNNVDDTKVLQEDAKILKIIEAYCTSVRSRHTVNSSILDNPNMLIAEDEKIICEVLRDNETVIEEKTLVDTVYVIKDQLKELQQEYHKLRKEFDDEKRTRKKLESIVQRHIGGTSRIPKSPLVNSTNNIVRTTSKPIINHSQSMDETNNIQQAEET